MTLDERWLLKVFGDGRMGGCSKVGREKPVRSGLAATKEGERDQFRDDALSFSYIA